MVGWSKILSRCSKNYTRLLRLQRFPEKRAFHEPFSNHENNGESLTRTLIDLPYCFQISWLYAEDYHIACTTNIFTNRVNRVRPLAEANVAYARLVVIFR